MGTLYLFNGQSVNTQREWGKFSAPFFNNNVGVLPYYYWGEDVRDTIEGNWVSTEFDTSMQCYGRGTLGCRVQPGVVMCYGSMFIKDSAEDITVDTADPSNDRYDLVVVEFDLTADPPTADIVVEKGTPATSPTCPVPSRTVSKYQVTLAVLKVEAAAGAVGSNDVYDYREFCTEVGSLNFVYGSGEEALRGGSGPGTIAQGIKVPRGMYIRSIKVRADTSGSVDLKLYSNTFGDAPSVSTGLISDVDFGLSSAQENNFFSDPDDLDGSLLGWTSRSDYDHIVPPGQYLTLWHGTATNIGRLFITLNYYDLGNERVV